MPSPENNVKIDAANMGYEFYIRHIALTLRFSAEKKMESYGITSAQGRLLGILYEAIKDNIKISRRLLEDFMHLKGPSVTSLLNGLEKNGFIKRSASAKDARAMVIEITAKGQAIINDMAKIFEQAEENLVERMSPQEKETFKKLLITAFENISK